MKVSNIKARRFLMLAALFCPCLSGCGTVRYLKDISQVTYSSESGTILPELQWYEQIVITRDRVTLSRNGKTADTEVNAGTWELAVDGQQVTALFAQLEAIDCSAIKEVRPDEATEGGDTETYSVVYRGGRTFSLVYGGGTTYTGGTAITTPIDAFVKGLALPTDAASRYSFSGDQP